MAVSHGTYIPLILGLSRGSELATVHEPVSTPTTPLTGACDPIDAAISEIAWQINHR